MIDFASRIEKNIRRGRKVTGRKVFENICFNLIKETSLSLHDICNSPTPLILKLNSELAEYIKKQNKSR